MNKTKKTKKKSSKKEKLPVPRLEFDEDCGNIMLVHKPIDEDDRRDTVDGACDKELFDGESLDYAKKFAKQIGLPLYASIMMKTKVV